MHIFFSLFLVLCRLSSQCNGFTTPIRHEWVLTSCRGNCGIDTALCSCQSKCRVFRNCCEDFATQCPEVFNDTAGIGHLLGIETKCHESGYFVVASCGQRGGGNGPENMTTGSETTTIVSYYDTSALLEDLLSRVPVMDSSTGISFANSDTFSCHSQAQSKPVKWDIQLILTDALFFSNLDELVKSRFVNSSVLPPKSADISYRDDFCFPNAIKTCPPAVYESDPFTYHKCESFISYVAVKEGDGFPDEIYNNVYCFRCWNTPPLRKFVYIDRFINKHDKSRGFSALMEIGDKGFVFKPAPDAMQFAFTWSQIVCPVDTSREPNQDRVSCMASACKLGAILTSDSRCLYERKFRIAIGRGENKSLTLDQLDSLPSLFACSLGQEGYDYVIDDDQSDVRQPFEFYSESLGVILYTFEINVMWLRFDIDYKRCPLFPILDAINKALALQVSAVDTTELRNGIDDVIGNKTNTRQLFETDVTAMQDEFISGLDEIERLEGKVSPYKVWYADEALPTNSKLTTTCVCSQDRTLVSACTLVCWQAPVFRTDHPHIQNYSASRCFTSRGSRNFVGLKLSFCAFIMLPALILLVQFF